MVVEYTLKREDVRTDLAIVAPILSCVLTQIVERNDSVPDNGPLTLFHSQRPPSVSVRGYLDRIVKYANCSPECYILALIYLDRIIERNPTMIINALTVHRLLITSVMTAAKFFDDFYYNNAYYARVGGISCQEMNSLELEFLYLLSFNLHVKSNVFACYERELLTHYYNLESCACCSKNMRSRGTVPVQQTGAIEKQQTSSTTKSNTAASFPDPVSKMGNSTLGSSGNICEAATAGSL